MAINVQDTLLSFVKRERIPVAIYLSKGVQLKGQVLAFDNFTILLQDTENKLQMIYKHAATTVCPLKNVTERYLKEVFKSDKDEE